MRIVTTKNQIVGDPGRARDEAPAGAEPAKRRSADTVQRVHDELRRMVMQFEIRPNERINEVELAQRFSVSRTPLREALNRLVTEGLLGLEPNRGFRSRSLETSEIVDLYEARAIIEVAAIRLACRRASDADVQSFDEYWASVPGLLDRPVEALAHDEEFHERLVGLSGNPELPRALRAINARIHFVRMVDLGRRERRELTHNEHGLVVEALRRRDEDECASILSRHIERRQDEIVDVIKAGVVHLFYR